MQNKQNQSNNQNSNQPDHCGCGKGKKQDDCHCHPGVETHRKDGQEATSENVYKNLAKDAWFPAIYADEVLMNDFENDYPEI